MLQAFQRVKALGISLRAHVGASEFHRVGPFWIVLAHVAFLPDYTCGHSVHIIQPLLLRDVALRTFDSVCAR